MKKTYPRGSVKLIKRKRIPHTWWFYIIEGKGADRKMRVHRLGDIKTLRNKEEARMAADALISATGNERTISELLDARLRNARQLSGFSSEWYQMKLAEQLGLCAICGRSPKNLVVDHDHLDGTLRGLLCGTCNSGIGMLKDDPVMLLKAVGYLESYGR